MSKAILLPPRIARLERDARGYPIPFGVLRGDDGTPFFTVNDDRLRRRALQEELCPICGERLGKWKWFVGGPQSAFHERGWFIDLPMHSECARFALATCPYLAAPRYLSRSVERIPHADKLPPAARLLLDETVMPDRPELFVAVASAQVEISPRRLAEAGGAVLELGAYVRPKRPVLDYEFWRLGERLGLAEALPLLRAALGEAFEPPERAD